MQQNTNTTLQDLDALVKSIKQSTSKHLLNSSWLLFLSFIFILSGLACLIFIFVMKNVWPFYIIDELQHANSLQQFATTNADVNAFAIFIKILFAICGFAFLYIAMLCNNLRTKNAIIQQTGKKLKDINTQMQTQFASLEPSTNADDLKIKEAKDLEFLD